MARLIAAGYSTEIEAAHAVKQRREDEAAAAVRRKVVLARAWG